MQNTQSNNSTGATQESPEWIHVTINRSSSAPPPIIKQERRSHTPVSDVQRIARNATPTSPAYSGSPRREVPHASMNWTDCTDDGCQIHLSEKQGLGWYPQFTRRSRKPSVAHDHDWPQEMEANPGEDWAPQQQPRQRKVRRAHGDLTSWEHCFKLQLQGTPLGKGGRRILPQTSGRKRGTVEERQKGTEEKKSSEDTAGGRGERTNHGKPGGKNLGPPKPARSRCPNHCGKG